MGANFSGGGATVFHDRTDAPGEIIRELVNASDGQGLHFDGAGYINIPNSAAEEFGTSDFSIEFILNQTEENTSDSYIFFTHIGGKNRFYVRHDVSESSLIMTFRNESDVGLEYIIDYDMNADFGIPTHYAITCNRDGYGTLYKNGNSVGTIDISSASAVDLGSGNANLGRISYEAGNGVIGTFYRFRTWNKALSQPEVTATYENATVPFADQYGALKSNEAMTANDGPYDTIVRSTLTQATVGSATASKLMADSTASNTHYARDNDGSSIFTNWDKPYVITADIYIPSGNSLVDGVAFSNHDAVIGGANTFLVSTTSGASVGQTIAADTWVTVTTTSITFEDKAWDLGLTLADGTAVSFTGNGSDYIGIKNQKIQQSGCVADYDLAFAQPEISTIIQNRSGSGDGTSSATGVKQVTPIEQLNAKALSVGTTAATPADGELVVGGVVKVASTVEEVLPLSTTNSSCKITFGRDGVGNSGPTAFIRMNEPGATGTSQLQLATGSSATPTARLTIDSAGKSTFTTAGVVPALFQSTNASYGSIQLDNTATGGDNWYLMSTADGHVHGGGYFSLYNEDTTTHAIKVSPAGLTTVKNPGWPLKNELTNSGFDVWSNSTLEDVTGTNLVSSWDDVSYPYETFTTSGANITQAVNSTDVGIAAAVISNPVVGKLYEISFSIAKASGTMPFVITATSEGYSNGSVYETPTAGPNTYVFEASANDVVVQFWVNSGVATDFAVSSFTLKEVTAGCVAADNLGPDGWAKDATLDVWRQHDDGGTLTKDGSFYSLKTTSGASSDWIAWGRAVNTNPEWYQRFAGRTVTFGCWAKASVASHCRLTIDDGAVTVSDYHTGGGGWEWLEVTRTIAAAPTKFYVYIELNVSGQTAYISQPMLVFGSAIGAGNYSRPSGEIVNCEKQIPIIENGSPAAADDKTLNLEALSNGKIPKGAKAIAVRAQVSNSSVTSGHGINYGATSSSGWDVDNVPVVDSMYALDNGVVNCDSNGDIYQRISEADATLSVQYLSANSVHLR